MIRCIISQVISTSGDTHLGGEDFDHRVMDYFIKLIKRKYKVDIKQDNRALQKLRREAERAKRALSSAHQVRAFTTLQRSYDPSCRMLQCKQRIRDAIDD